MNQSEQSKRRPKRGHTPWPASQRVLLHTCFDQSKEMQPSHCACSDRISEQAARRLIRNGLAQWLFFERCGTFLPNRKSIVLTPEAVAHRAHSQDALNYKYTVSITSFSDSYPSPERMQSGIDRTIEAIRIQTMKKHKLYRKHRVKYANNRKGPGGLTVGVGGKVVLCKANWSKGNGPDAFERQDPNDAPEKYSRPGQAEIRTGAFFQSTEDR